MTSDDDGNASKKIIFFLYCANDVAKKISLVYN